MSVGGTRLILKISRRFKPVVVSSFNRCNSSLTDPNILKSPFKNVDIPNKTIPELIFERTEKWGHHIAMECAVTGRNYTYSQLNQYSENLAAALRKKFKLNKGDVVAIMLPNCPEYAIVVFGIMHGGMIFTSINPIYTADEICRQLLDSGAKIIVTMNELWPTIKAAINSTRKSIPVISVSSKEGESTPEGAINLREIFECRDNVDGIDVAVPSDVAAMPYSSGTTGLPKGVLLTHSNIVSNLTQFGIPEVNVIMDASAEHQDVIPLILPQFHIYGLVLTTFLTTSKCSKHICLPTFDPKLYIDVLIKHKPDVLFIVPPLILFMSTQEAVKPEYLSSVRTIVCGAAPLGAPDEEKFLKKAKKNINISQGYGCTECSPVIAVKRLDKPSPPGSNGPPVPNTELKIVDSNNLTSHGPNQTGEIWTRGPQVMKGYHNNPEATQETIVDGGWLRTGDIGFYDEDGNLSITDRLKELIKVKGFQVPPAELEEVIRQYPDVLEVGVIGIPDERSGQVPRAYVVMKSGTNLDKNKLQEFVKSKVASYKELKGGVCVIDALPKNTTGKILRRELRELYKKQ